MTKTKETRLDRAKKQRLYYMGRAPSAEDTWSFLVSGSSGKIYTVTIMKYMDDRGRTLKCNCMDHTIRKRNCKHILFLCLRVLKLSEERVQGIASGNSINSDELAEIATNAGGDIAHEFSAPKYMTQYLRSLVGDRLEDGESSKKGHVAHREPEDGDDCPICFDDLKGDGGELVYCRYGCGKAIHKECFERWRQSKERSGEQVTCVYCRTPWSVDTGGGDETKIGGRGLLLGGRLIQIGDEDHPGEPTEQLTQRVANERAKSKRKRRTEAVAGTKEGRVKKGTKKTAKKTATKKAATKKTAPKKTAKKYQQTVEEEPKQYVEPKGARKSSRIAKQHKN